MGMGVGPAMGLGLGLGRGGGGVGWTLGLGIGMGLGMGMVCSINYYRGDMHCNDMRARVRCKEGGCAAVGGTPQAQCLPRGSLTPTSNVRAQCVKDCHVILSATNEPEHMRALAQLDTQV